MRDALVIPAGARPERKSKDAGITFFQIFKIWHFLREKHAISIIFDVKFHTKESFYI